VISSLSGDGDSSSSNRSIVGELLPTNGATRGDGLGAALGQLAPRLVGESLDGTPLTVSPGGGVRHAIVFLAHWCVHCQREVRAIVGMAERGELRGVEVTAVLTATARDRPNYPPAKWLAREKWPFPAFADNSDGTAADAYGVTTVPTIVLADSDARVVARLADFRDDAALRVLRDFAAAQPTTTS
jgi:thiol-disulfide isomerase/thioredoxin